MRQVIGLVLLLAASNARADCEAILKYGIRDTKKTFSSQERFDQVKNLVCSSNSSDYQSAKSEAQNIGIGVDIFSLDFGGKSATQNYQAWKSAFCSSNFSEASSKSKFDEVIEKTSDLITQAWEKCIAVGGFHFWIEPGDSPKSFTVTAKFVPTGAVNQATLEYPISILPAGKTQCAPMLEKGAAIKASGVIINCERSDPSDSITITVNTTEGTGRVVLPAYKPAPAAPAKGDDHTECVKGDASACSRYGGEIAKNCGGNLDCQRRAACWEDRGIYLLQGESAKNDPIRRKDWEAAGSRFVDCDSQPLRSRVF